MLVAPRRARTPSARIPALSRRARVGSHHHVPPWVLSPCRNDVMALLCQSRSSSSAASRATTAASSSGAAACVVVRSAPWMACGCGPTSDLPSSRRSSRRAVLSSTSPPAARKCDRLLLLWPTTGMDLRSSSPREPARAILKATCPRGRLPAGAASSFGHAIDLSRKRECRVVVVGCVMRDAVRSACART